MKNCKYLYDTSTSKLAPNFLCVSTSTYPPENAYLFIFFFIYFAVSVKKIAEFVSLEDIFLPIPYKAGKNFEYIEVGFGNFNFYAISLVILK